MIEEFFKKLDKLPKLKFLRDPYGEINWAAWFIVLAGFVFGCWEIFHLLRFGILST